MTLYSVSWASKFDRTAPLDDKTDAVTSTTPATVALKVKSSSTTGLSRTPLTDAVCLPSGVVPVTFIGSAPAELVPESAGIEPSTRRMIATSSSSCVALG